ncbi:MAG TPA: glycosyltransferase family 4 protein [Devosia sp.]|nr:glycosyltransferase family 4 protein [Devosia sp.]
MADDRPLRILQVLRAPVGGLFRHVYDLTEELARRGHQIGVVADSLTSDAMTGQRLRALAPSISLGTYYFPMPRTVGWGDVTTPLQVRALAARLNIEVLHGHGAKGGVHARLARVGNRHRVALNTPHGGVLNYKPGTAVGGFFRGIERMIGGFTDAYIFESAYAQKAFHRLIGPPPCAEAVIHNGLAPHEFDPLPCDPTARDFVFVGEFREAKGIGYLIEALGGVTAPDGRPATLAMAGSGPEFEATKARIASLGLSERIELLGVRPVREALTRGRCLVVASLAESLPYVILEGASAGRPVLSTNVGGISEIFGPTSDKLFPPADAAALRTAMQGYLDDPESARREAQIRLDYIRPRFSIAHMADQIEALYRQVLARRRGQDPAID